MLIRTVATLLFVLVTATFTAAEPLPVPKVEYSADNVITTGGMMMTSRMYVTQNKQRMETSVGEGKSIIISRMDKDLSWVLMPEQKTYMEMSLAEGRKKSRDVYSCDSKLKNIGKETVNGVSTTKSSFSSSCPDGGGVDGTIWISKDGIMMRMEGTTKADGNEMPVKMELKNLKIGKQDAKLFEVPAGYSKFDMSGTMQSLQSIMKKAEQDAKRAEEKARKKEEEKQRRQEQEAQSGRDYTSQGRDYTSQGRDYTSQGRSYTASERKKASKAKKKGSDAVEPAKPSGGITEPVIDEVGKKLKGWLGF